MSASYNAGGNDIPGDIVEPVEHVIIVGAGIAGLTAANALTHAGVSCVVVEARDRIGGRLHTVDLGGSPGDLGGSWIHHPIGNPVRNFANQMGIPCAAGDPLPQLSAYDRLESRQLGPRELAMNLKMETGYADNAMSSGIREAKRLLRRSSVELGLVTTESTLR